MPGMAESTTIFVDVPNFDDDAKSDDTNSSERISDHEGEPATKKARTITSDTLNETLTPRWSNPDPYTALPPTNLIQARKVDFVQMIKDAKKKKEIETSTNEIVENNDFISLSDPDPQSRTAPGSGNMAFSSSKPDPPNLN
jgi:non-canonical poly(A) RNA polymerase PAPD5/7